jgi:hypothetical protein
MGYVSNLAISQVRARHPNANSRGFYKIVRDALWCSQPKDDSHAELGQSSQTTEVKPLGSLSAEERRSLWNGGYKPRFMPDLFELDERTHEIRLFEIEDTHPLTASKLWEIVKWWRITLFAFLGREERNAACIRYAGADYIGRHRTAR